VTLACKGLLIEESRTNLLTFSEQLTNAAWTPDAVTPCVITANQAVAPDGTTSAELMQEDTARTGTFVFLRTAGITITASSTQVYSVYAKAGTISQIQITLTTANNGGQAYFDLTEGTITTSGAIGTGQFIGAGITNVGNGWYRCSLAAVVGTATTINPRILLAKSSNSTYTGTGTGNVLLWGAQLEAGAFATSYIPTTSASVTRAADVAQITGSNFTSFYNQSSGSFLWAGDLLGLRPAGTSYPVYISNAGATDSLVLREGIVIGGVDVTSSSGGSFQADTGSASVTLNSPAKYAVGYATNNLAFCANGSVIGTDSSCVFPTNSAMTLFYLNLGTTNGHVRSLAYYPTRLTDDQLQSLTA
jgi:hypothetical protein